MTKDQFRELLTRFMADSGVLVTVDPTGLRNFNEMYQAVDKFRDKLANKLYERYARAISWDDFYADVDGVGGKGIPPEQTGEE